MKKRKRCCRVTSPDLLLPSFIPPAVQMIQYLIEHQTQEEFRKLENLFLVFLLDFLAHETVFKTL